MNLYEYIANYDKEIQFENILTDEMFHSPMTIIDYMNKNPEWYKDEEFRHSLKETIAGEASCELNRTLLDIENCLKLMIMYRYTNCNQLAISLLIEDYHSLSIYRINDEYMKSRCNQDLFDMMFKEALYSVISISKKDKENILIEMGSKLSFDILFDIDFLTAFLWKYRKSQNMINYLNIQNIELFKEMEEKFKDYV